MKHLIAALVWLVAMPATAADVVWVTDDTPSVRFLDGETAGPTFSAFSRLVVLYEDGDKYRVKEANAMNWGWIPKAGTTAEEPDEAKTELPDGALPDFQKMLEEIQAQQP